MVNREQIKGQWNEVKGRLKEHWGELTDDDLQRIEGSTDQLAGVVQQKTGATKGEIERLLDSVPSGNFSEQAAETMQHYVEAARATAADAGTYARES